MNYHFCFRRNIRIGEIKMKDWHTGIVESGGLFIELDGSSHTTIILIFIDISHHILIKVMCGCRRSICRCCCRSIIRWWSIGQVEINGTLKVIIRCLKNELLSVSSIVCLFWICKKWRKICFLFWPSAQTYLQVVMSCGDVFNGGDAHELE